MGPATLVADDDYPDFANPVCTQMKDDDQAILICGSGHGMDIAANRYPHIRAILGFNQAVVEQGRAHENANVLVLPADWLSQDEANALIDIFLNTPFSQEPRHIRRISKLKTVWLFLLFKLTHSKKFRPN